MWLVPLRKCFILLNFNFNLNSPMWPVATRMDNANQNPSILPRFLLGSWKETPASLGTQGQVRKEKGCVSEAGTGSLT